MSICSRFRFRENLVFDPQNQDMGYLRCKSILLASAKNAYKTSIFSFFISAFMLSDSFLMH